MKAIGMPSLEQLEPLYEQARFLDIWNLTAQLWDRPDTLDGLGSREIVFAARVADRLGNRKYFHALMRVALQREPDSLLVRYYARGMRARRDSMLDALREFEDSVEGTFPDNELKASWCSAYAVMLARVRDFKRAHDLMQRALDCAPPHAYTICNHAFVMLCEDRWDEAHALATQCWQKAPGQPYGADILVLTARSVARERDAVEQLIDHFSQGGQSGSSLEIALFAAVMVAARLPEGERGAYVARMQQVAGQLPGLFPLADRAARIRMDAVRLSLAYEVHDWETVRELASRIDAPFFNSVVENHAANPQGRRVLLPHEPVRQRHNTCLPASVAAIASSAGRIVDQDALSAAISFEGTAMWRARDWARAAGFTTRSFVFRSDAAQALIDRGIPFLISFVSLNNAHACAAVGYDAAAGTALIHDPGDARINEMLLSRLDQVDAPLGPQCMAILTAEQSELAVDLALPQESEEELRLDVVKALETAGPTSARSLVEELPDTASPVARFLRAVAQSLAGHTSASVEAFAALLSEYPQCAQLQRHLLHALDQHGNSARIAQTLHSIVTSAPLPGVDGSQRWIYPEPHLLGRYGSLLMQDASRRNEAARWFRRALLRGPMTGETYFHLGNLHVLEDEPALALLPFRIASLLELSNESAAEAYSTELFKQGYAEEGVAWLRERVDRYAEGIGAAGPWITLVSQVEHFGMATEALAELETACERRPDDGELAAFATSFFSHYGRYDAAAEALDVARRTATRTAARMAEMRYYRARGDLARAKECAEAWYLEAPLFENAIGSLLHLTDAVEGSGAALDLAEKLNRQAPDHDGIEELLIDRLALTPRARERAGLLRKRVQRNPHDAWAWRELALHYMDGAAAATASGQSGLRDFREAVEQCTTISPEHPLTVYLQGELAVFDARPEEAIELFRRSLDREPTSTAPLRRALFFARADAAKANAVLDTLARSLARVRHPLETASDAASLIASHFGRERALVELEKWEQHAPGDPNIIQARAELAINRGGGIDAVAPLLPELEKAARGYPVHVGIHHTLARCYSILLRHADAIEQLHLLLRFAAYYTPAYVMLAEIHEKVGDNASAENALRSAVDRNPLDPQTWHALADHFANRGRLRDVAELLEQACARVPNEMSLHSRLTHTLWQMDDLDEADRVSRRVAENFPERAYAQLIRARAMRNLPGRTSRSETEQQFVRAMSLDTELWEAVDEYADFLCDQAQFTSARELLAQRRACFTDPVVLDSKIIEVDRRETPRQDQAERMARLLEARPDYEAGWRLFIAWVEQDRLGMLARRVLPHMPANLGEDVSLQCDKLSLLLQAGEPMPSIEEAWWQLISNHPDSMEVNLRWFDTLMDRGRVEDAESVLDVYAQHDATHPHVLSRRVAVQCARKNKAAALDAADTLWQSTPDARHAAYVALEALQRANYVGLAVGRLMKLRAEGQSVMRSAMLAAPEYVTQTRPLQTMAETESARGDAQADPDIVGNALLRLTNLENGRWVKAFLDKHPDLVRRSTYLWQIVGEAEFARGSEKRAAEWLKGWRDKPDVQMWAVCTYVAARLNTGDPTTAARDGFEALETLDHDGSAPQTARNALLACWIVGDQAAYRVQYSRFAYLAGLDNPSDSILYQLDLCNQLVNSVNPTQTSHINLRMQELAAGGGLILPKPFLKAWDAAIKPRLTRWQRFVYRLRALNRR